MTDKQELDLSRAIRAKMDELAREQGLTLRDCYERFREAADVEIDELDAHAFRAGLEAEA